MQETSDAGLKGRYAAALAAPTDPALLQRTLAAALDTATVRPQVRPYRGARSVAVLILPLTLHSTHYRLQDTISFIASVASNVYGRSLAWQTVKDNWSLLESRYNSAGSSMTGIVVSGGW